MTVPSCYVGRNVALLTQHGKGQIIAPLLESTLGCFIELVSGFDTDQLGTFTREIARPGSHLDAARRNARIGIELAETIGGIASEGSFGVDPHAACFRGIQNWCCR